MEHNGNSFAKRPHLLDLNINLVHSAREKWAGKGGRMRRMRLLLLLMAFGMPALEAFSQVKNFAPVTDQVLLNPSPDDWILPSRTYDWQRYSPLSQVTRQNVGQLRMAWARG